MRSRRQDIFTEPDANGGELRTRNFPTRQHVQCQEGLKINVQAVRFRLTVGIRLQYMKWNLQLRYGDEIDNL